MTKNAQVRPAKTRRRPDVPRGAATFRQRDLAAALKAAKAAGIDVVRIEIDPVTGRLVIITCAEAAASATHLDKWLTKHGERST